MIYLGDYEGFVKCFNCGTTFSENLVRVIDEDDDFYYMFYKAGAGSRDMDFYHQIYGWLPSYGMMGNGNIKIKINGEFVITNQGFVKMRINKDYNKRNTANGIFRKIGG